MNIILSALFHKKDSMVYYWINGKHELIEITDNLMNNLLLMIYQNQTFSEVTENESNNYISLLYSKLANLYKVQRYEKSLSGIVNQNNSIIDYDCSSFYNKLKNDIFEQLKYKFINESEKFYNTMISFCSYSNFMNIKNGKTLYLQLFSKVNNIIENFPNREYKDIIQYARNYSIAKIQIIFLTIFKYIIDINFDDSRNTLLNMSYKVEDIFIIFGITYILLIVILLIIIYFVCIKNINNDVNKFIQARKIFKVCDTNE